MNRCNFERYIIFNGIVWTDNKAVSRIKVIYILGGIMLKNTMLSLLLIMFFCASASAVEQVAPVRSIYQLTLAELFDIEVVSAVSGFEQKTSNAPATVTVINKEQWQLMGATSLSEVLSSVPGVHVGQPKFLSYYNTSFTIRGLSGLASAKVKLMIDGLPFENMQVSGLMWGFYMPLSGFSRIEVIKGPGSAVYGADAYAGIINLVTEPIFNHKNSNDKGELELNGDVGVRVGSFNDLDIMTNTHLAYGKHRMVIGLDVSHSNDDESKIIEEDLQTTLDSIFGTDASKTPGHYDQSYEIFKLLVKWQYNNWSADYFTWRNLDIGIGTGGAQSIVEQGSFDNQYERFTLNFRQEQFLTGSLDWQYSHMQQTLTVIQDVFPNGSILPIGSDGNVSFNPPFTPTLFTDGLIGKVGVYGSTDTLNMTHLIDYGDENFMRIQVGFEQQDFHVNEEKNFGPGVLDGTQTQVDGQLTNVTGTPYVFIEDVDRNFWYASLHRHWQFSEDVLVSAGLRYDEFSDFGSTTNPRFSLLFKATEKFTIKMFAGSAFKAPTIAQLYARNNPSTLGNLGVKEERVNTLELGNSLQYFVDDNLVFGLNVFRYRAKDLIGFVDNVEGEGRIAQNGGEQLGYGGEFTFKWKPEQNITIESHYSYLSAKDGMNKDIVEVPTKMFYISANWQINEQAHLALSTKWVGERTRQVNDLRPNIASYALTTIKVNYRHLFDEIDGAIVIKNVFDRKAKEPSVESIKGDLPLDGQQVLLELRHHF